MAWEKPQMREIKMDSEIGSYQVDDEPVERARGATAPSPAPEASRVDWQSRAWRPGRVHLTMQTGM